MGTRPNGPAREAGRECHEEGEEAGAGYCQVELKDEPEDVAQGLEKKSVEASVEGEGASASASPREALKPAFTPMVKQTPRWESCRELRLKKEDVSTTDIGFGGERG